MATRPKKAAGGDSHRFDVAALRELAGEKVFARGVQYNQEGQVEIVSIDRSRVLARVIGSEIYRSELEGAGEEFSGACSCPAFSDWGFCKHLVATALAVNGLGPEAAEQAAGRLSKIRDHLRSKGVESLVEMIVKLAENDPDLLRSVELASTIGTADDDALFAQFKKAITGVTRTQGYIEYGEARAWAEKIERLLDQIAELIAGGRSELVLRLLNYFFARMDQALQSIDDSDGEGGAIYAKACEIHLAACRKAKPAPVALARELFARETEANFDFFYGASETYADVLGETGRAEYRRLADKAWQAIKPLRAGGRRVHDEQSGERYRLAAILDGFAQRDGDVDARIAIRSADLSMAHDYLEIARLCVESGRDADAVKWAEEGLWQFEDHPDERLVFFTVDLYRRIGRPGDAGELLWQSFERNPSIELYRKLKKAAGAGRATVDAARDRAISLLRTKLDKSGVQARWSSPRELLLEVLTSERLFAEAWQVVRRHACSGAGVLALAHASEREHPDEAVSTYTREAERLANLGGNDNYKAANELITRMQSIRKGLGKDAEHASFLADFASRHKAKRNLMKVLQANPIAGTTQHGRSAAAR
jgi:uncharacterized Zn finger protein